MASNQDNWVDFTVEYEDGSTAWMSVDPGALKQGDFVATAIARERQEDGSIPAGKIKSVKRANR